jgi:photosystem II stability/assembly factor-like uncharacterized protein
MRILEVSALALLLTAMVARGATPPPTLRRIGPEGGSITALARAPLVDAPLFAVSTRGELFRLGPDGGWQSVASGIGNVVPDPVDARVVYALPRYSGRLLRSRDGGTTWAADTGLNTEDPEALVLVPSNGSAFVSSAGAIFRSRDGLRSWIAVLGRQTDDEYAAVQLSLGTVPNPIIYAYLPGAFLQRSEDDGATWIPAALPDGECSSGLEYCTAIRVDPRDARRLLIGVGSAIYRSADAGDTWQLATMADSGAGSGYVTVTDIAIDPTDSQRAYASRDTGLLVSNDGGEHWQPSAAGPDAAAIRRLLVDPTEPRTLYIGSGDLYGYAGDGVHVSRDRGETWQAMNRGLFATCVTAMTVVSPDTIFAGGCGIDTGLLLTTDAGQTWRSARRGLPTRTRVRALAVVGGDHLDVVYAGLEREGVYRSEDAGAHWLPTNVGEWSVTDLSLGSGAAPLLYAAVGYDGIWASSDGGASWDPADAELPLGNFTGQVDRIVADPADPLRAYAVVNFSVSTLALFRTVDGGRHWSPVGSTLPRTLIDDVAVSAADPYQLYAAGFDESIYASGDRGDSWYRTGLSERYPGFIRLAADPVWPGTVYATTSSGRILRSDDRGDTWQVLVRDLDLGGASPLVAVGEPRTLFLQSFNQGVLTYGPLPPPNVAPPCAGDCNGDRAISIAELVTSVNIAIGYDSVGICPRADANDDDDVSIDELISAVAAALSGCA